MTTDLLNLDADKTPAGPSLADGPCPVCGAHIDEACAAIGPAGICPRGEPTRAAEASAEDPDGERDADMDAKLTALVGELAQPGNTSGVYMVLWAHVPDQGVKAEHRHRPDWQEIAYVTASSRDVARARAIEHDGRAPAAIEERGPVARYLIEQARTTPSGIMLRAVPAEYWPAACPVTSYTVPAPILTLGQ